MKKKLFYLFSIAVAVFMLICASVFSVSAEVVDSGTCGDALTWTFDGSTLTISGTGKIYDYQARTVPWREYKNDIKVLVIEDGVTSIGDYAFCNLPALSDVSLSDTLLYIGGYSFAYCTSIQEISFPDSLLQIGEYSFDGCKGISDITIPAGVRVIGVGVFAKADGLKEIIVDENNRDYCSVDGVLYSENVETLISYPLAKSVEIFVFPDTVTSIYAYAFSGVSQLKQIYITGDLSRVGVYAFTDFYSLENIYLPDSITEIADYAFLNCKSLKSITIPENVRRIGLSAFYNCTSLSLVSILNPDCVFEEDDRIFPEATLIRSYSDSTAQAYAQTYNRSFAEIIAEGTCGENLIWCLDSKGTLEISGEGAIADVSFPQYVPWYDYRRDIVTINIESGITAVGEYAFYGSTSLTQVNMNEGITSIHANAFKGCSSLTEILLPDSVTEIERNVFEECIALETFNIPASLSSLGNDVFEDCSALAEFTISEGNLYFSVADGILYNKNMTSLIVFPPDKEVSVFVIPDSVKSIANNAVYGNQHITSIVMNENLSSISQYGFFGCGKLREIIFNEKLSSLGMHCFGECVLLEEVILPESVRRMDSAVFEKCTSLRRVVLPSGITAIPDSCFSQCTALENVEYPQTVTEIGRYAFYNCDYITSITLPEALSSIDIRAFMECDGLTEINIPRNVSDMGSEIFFECHRLKEITVDEGNEYFSAADGVLYDKTGETLLCYPAGKTNTLFVCPESVTAIGPGAFEYAVFLECVFLSDSVTELSEYCFYYCESLENIYIPFGVTVIGDAAFFGCEKLRSLVIPEGVVSFPDDMLHFCTSLETLIFLNPDCDIVNFDSYSAFNNTIVGYPGSTAQAYAEEFGCSFIAINDTLQSPADWSFSEGVLTISCNSVPAIASDEVFLWYCYASMTDAVFFEDISYVSANAFRGFGDTTIIMVNGQNAIIEDGAFLDCRNLMSMVVNCDVLVNEQAFGNNESDVKLLVAEDYLYTGNMDIIRFSKDADIVKFDSDITVSYYDFFNIISAICHIYSGESEIMKLYFPTFHTTDFSFNYKWSNQGLVPVTEYANIFVYPVVDVNYESIEISFNELCDNTASGAIERFSLIAIDDDNNFGNADVDNTQQENGFVAGIQRILRAIVTFFNKLLNLFKRK